MTQLAIATQFTSTEITFYDHEIHSDGKHIASIAYDHDDFETQRWVVVIDDEVHRANTWQKCYDWVIYHYLRGDLPVMPEETERGSGRKLNWETAQIAEACDHHNLQLWDENHIYAGSEKIGHVWFENDCWWAKRGTSREMHCDSADQSVAVLQLAIACEHHDFQLWDNNNVYDGETLVGSVWYENCWWLRRGSSMRQMEARSANEAVFLLSLIVGARPRMTELIQQSEKSACKLIRVQ